MAVDLGGTNFRVCSVTLLGNSNFKIAQEKTQIPRDLMVGTSKKLFSFMAQQIKNFVETHHSDHFTESSEHRLQLGFTFSFPVDQKAVNKGYLIRWTKGFDIKDAVGQDVCELLQNEIDALEIPVRVAALVNDTVGTLMARSYESPGKHGALIGAIFGTGTNGAYVENLDKLTKMTAPGNTFGEYDKSTGEMVVNTEWGNFDKGMNVLPDTEFDRQLDRDSVNPGIQMFEKRVSGMFLGEILRLTVLKLKNEAGMFSTSNVKENAPLFEQWGVDTSVLSDIEGDKSEDLSQVRQVAEEKLGVSEITLDEARALKILVHAIGKRSARLSAVPIAAIILATGKLSPAETTTKPTHQRRQSLIEKATTAFQSLILGNPPAADTAPAGPATDDEPIDVGVDGSVVEFYPGFEEYLREALREVNEVGNLGEKRVRIGIAKDGSGVGAALIALVATKAALMAGMKKGDL